MPNSHGWLLAAATSLALLTGAAAAQPAAAQSANAQEPPFTLRTGARVQIRATHAAPADAPDMTALSIRRARLSLSGAAYHHFNYAIQLELAGASARLLDANVTSTLAPWATIWAGQGKAFFGRQQLTSSGNLHFVDRTIVDGRFAAGRQQGLGLTGRLADGRVEYNAGVYNGNGINQTTNPNNRFMTVARVVAMPLGAYAPVESAHDYPAAPRLAVGLSALDNTTGEGATETGIRRVNAEAAFKLRGLNMTAEFYREWAEPHAAAQVVTDGWYYQAGYLLPGRTHELAGRWAVIAPHAADAANAGDTIETGVGYSYYFAGHRAKLQTDLRNVRAVAADTDHRELRVQLQLTL
jgi:phosphate-selective porin OprO and OprP